MTISELLEKDLNESFKSQFLLEAIKPIKVDFGSDYPECNDKRPLTGNIGEGVSLSFLFKHQDECFAIFFTVEMPAEIAFAKIVSFDPESGFTFNFAPTDLGKPFEMFGKILYIVMEVMKKFKGLDAVDFSGASPKLDRLYNSLVNNKSFFKMLDKKGMDVFKRPGNPNKFFIVKRGTEVWNGMKQYVGSLLTHIKKED